MRRGEVRTNFVRQMACFCLAAVLTFSCNSNSYEGKIVLVELADLNSGKLEEARLIVVDPDRPDRKPVNLSKDFYAACAPAISHEGRYLYFQGKKAKEESWQIWVLDLQKGGTKKVSDLAEDCLQPAALPDGTVIFSRTISSTPASQSSLYRCKMDGSELTRLSFNPGTNLHPSVLDEGRVLYLSRQQSSGPAYPKLLIMRPDGTKSELYYRGYMGKQPISGGLESKDGFTYFIEEGGSLCRVSHKRPLHTYDKLSENLTGSFAAVSSYRNSRLLVSYRAEKSGNYGLYEYNAEAPVLLYEGEMDLTDPVWISELEERPRILPSAVNMEKSSGLLMSQNINHSMLPVHKNLQGDSLADRIRVLGVDEVLGEVEVEADGSFYLILDADKAVQIETLNSQGEVIRGPSDWIYLRPNERRACVGCHADHELAPDNTQPLAVKKAAVDLSTRTEKTTY